MNNDLLVEHIKSLQLIDTPTICNALELIDPNRRNYGYTNEFLHCLRPNLHPVCGIAKTATCRSFRPSELDGESLKKERIKYYTYVDSGDIPKIIVMQDLDGAQRGHGPFFGEFNTIIDGPISSPGN